MSKNTLCIYDECSSEGNSVVWDNNTIIMRNLLAEVREKRDVHLSKTSLVSRLVGILHVGEVRIN